MSKKEMAAYNTTKNNSNYKSQHAQYLRGLKQSLMEIDKKIETDIRLTLEDESPNTVNQ